jgi:hypothetical protein
MFEDIFGDTFDDMLLPESEWVEFNICVKAKRTTGVQQHALKISKDNEKFFNVASYKGTTLIREYALQDGDKINFTFEIG